MMSPPWVPILLYLIVLLMVTGYTLPLPDQPFLTGVQSRAEYSSSPPAWEWETQDKSEKTLLTLMRLVRDISDKKISDKKADVKYPSKTETVSKSPLKKLPEVTPKIVLPSKAPYSKPKTMAQVKAASSSEPDHTKAEEEYNTESEIIEPDKSLTLAITKKATQMEFTTTQEQFSTPSPTKGKELSFVTKSTPKEALTFGQIHSTKNKSVSSIPKSTGNTMVDDATSVVASKVPDVLASKVPDVVPSKEQPTTPSKEQPTTPSKEQHTTPSKHPDFVPSKVPDVVPSKEQPTTPSKVHDVVTSKEPDPTPSKPIVTSAKPTTHGETSGWIPKSEGSSTTPVPVTHISTTLEDKILTQSLLRQCMLAILMLAVVCTIFIITTIALAVKLCSMTQKRKLRYPATYTEMRCISTLLPESDQQSKVKPKRLKTFATMEDSDGDNTTLNSFLPEH